MEKVQDAKPIAVADTVKLSYVDQRHDDLAPDKTVFQEIT